VKLILASTSPYRRELLSRLGVPFEVVAPDVDETPLAGESPDDTAQRLSVLKARAVADKFPHALIIGSDQVALLEGRQLGKPGTHENAVAQLQSMRGKTLEFHTALTLLNAKTGRTQTANVPVRLVMRDYSDAQIDAYLRKDQPYNCCGSARSESLGIALIARYETEDPNALVGLPLIKLTEMLANEGLDVLTWQPST
jgi:septum formation protein